MIIPSLGKFNGDQGNTLHQKSNLCSTLKDGRGGTLFLDEIGDRHDGGADAAVARLLQQGEYTTVGGRTPIKTEVRIRSAPRTCSA
jgi:two-component system, NtrC family, nitrogen regulation response regulator GlnG